MSRDFEREIIPMARSEGLALAPWNALAAGKLRSDAEEERRRATGEKGRLFYQAGWERNKNEIKMSRALEKVGKEVGTEHVTAGKFFFHRSAVFRTCSLPICSVALAYLMQKTPYVFPIIGGRKVEHLHGNIEALGISLSDEQIKYLESILPFDPGFPTNMIVRIKSLLSIQKEKTLIICLLVFHSERWFLLPTTSLAHCVLREDASCSAHTTYTFFKVDGATAGDDIKKRNNCSFMLLLGFLS